MRPILAAILAAAPAVLAPVPAQPAETPMSAAEFEAYVAGKTLYYSSTGTPYGAEQYLSGRRVIWTFLDGECADGRWYEENGQICFVYELDLDPQCWTFWRRGDGLAARFENDPSAVTLYEVNQSPEPLRCLGPEVGA